MRPLILFVATSLDGHIARRDGGIDWLFDDGDYGMSEFYASIDTTLMGGETYRLALKLGMAVYPDKTNYVFTRQPGPVRAPHVAFVREDIVGFTRRLKEQDGKSIWLVGGAAMSRPLIEAGLVDEIILSVHPIVLGDGIALFEKLAKSIRLDLVSTRSFPSGLVQTRYAVRAS